MTCRLNTVLSSLVDLLGWGRGVGVEVEMVDLSKDLPIQVMDKPTFSKGRWTYPRYGKVDLFNSRLTNMLLWMQRLLLESLLNVYLLFYAPHVSLLVFLSTDIFHRQI